MFISLLNIFSKVYQKFASFKMSKLSKLSSKFYQNQVSMALYDIIYIIVQTFNDKCRKISCNNVRPFQNHVTFLPRYRWSVLGKT